MRWILATQFSPGNLSGFESLNGPAKSEKMKTPTTVRRIGHGSLEQPRSPLRSGFPSLGDLYTLAYSLSSLSSLRLHPTTPSSARTQNQ